jgi:hypothetical protein
MATTITPTHNLSGKVTSATTRSFTSKAGKNLTKTVITVNGYAVELEGFGDKTSLFPVGKDIQMGVAEAFGKWQVTGTTQLGLPMLGASAPAGASPAAGSGAVVKSGRGGFPIAGDDYQQSIIRQNSLTNAVATVSAIIRDYSTHEMAGKDDEPRMSLPALVEACSEHIIKLAYKYAAFSSGKLDTEAFQQIADRVLGSTKAE